MTSTVYAKLNVINKRSELINATFDAVDTKGRRFGARVRIDVIEFVPADDSVQCPYVIERDRLGLWYRVTPHATRDNKLFGASQHGTKFRTKDEALAYVGKYFSDAEKRALKNKKRAA